MRNRWFQLGAALVAMLMIANLQYAWTLFISPMAALTGWRLPAIQWAFSLFVLFQAWVQPVAAMLFDLLGGWSAVLYGCGALSLLSAALAYHLKVRPLPEKRSGVAIS